MKTREVTYLAIILSSWMIGQLIPLNFMGYGISLIIMGFFVEHFGIAKMWLLAILRVFPALIEMFIYLRQELPATVELVLRKSLEDMLQHSYDPKLILAFLEQYQFFTSGNFLLLMELTLFLGWFVSVTLMPLLIIRKAFRKVGAYKRLQF